LFSNFFSREINSWKVTHNTVTDPNDVNFHFTVDGCHLVFE